MAASRSQFRSDTLRQAIDTLSSERYASNQALEQAGGQLTAWLLAQQPQPEWKPDPFISTLPEELRGRGLMNALSNLRPVDAQADGRYIQAAIWLKEISTSLRAGQPDDLTLAQRLFDWTVRNIQLETDRPVKDGRGEVRRSIRYSPWEVLLLGHGTALHRAWIFSLLARQQGLDVIILARSSADPAASDSPRPWAAALVHQGELYLFEPTLGLPIPGPGETGVPLQHDPSELRPGSRREAREKPFRVATLSEVADDDSLLRQFDIDERPYSMKSDDVKQLMALVVSSPFSLSQRMAMIESKLSGQHRVVLTTDPTALADGEGGRKGLKSHKQIADVRLWTLPFEGAAYKAKLDEKSLAIAQLELSPLDGVGRLPMMPLRRGRLQHFRGQYEGEEGAKQYYMQSRPRSSELAQSGNLHPQERYALEMAKQNATYWLGLATYEEGDYATAVEHLSKRTLEESPDGPWTYGAQYNLARAYEALGELDKAIELYRNDQSPQRQGNQVRARRIEDLKRPAGKGTS